MRSSFTSASRQSPTTKVHTPNLKNQFKQCPVGAHSMGMLRSLHWNKLISRDNRSVYVWCLPSPQLWVNPQPPKHTLQILRINLNNVRWARIQWGWSAAYIEINWYLKTTEVCTFDDLWEDPGDYSFYLWEVPPNFTLLNTTLNMTRDYLSRYKKEKPRHKVTMTYKCTFELMIFYPLKT